MHSNFDRNLQPYHPYNSNDVGQHKNTHTILALQGFSRVCIPILTETFNPTTHIMPTKRNLNPTSLHNPQPKTLVSKHKYIWRPACSAAICEQPWPLVGKLGTCAAMNRATARSQQLSCWMLHGMGVRSCSQSTLI